MNEVVRYQRGQVLRVQIQGHREPIDMVVIEREGMNAGGGLILMIDRGDGELDAAVKSLNTNHTQAHDHHPRNA